MLESGQQQNILISRKWKCENFAQLLIVWHNRNKYLNIWTVRFIFHKLILIHIFSSNSGFMGGGDENENLSLKIRINL